MSKNTHLSMLQSLFSETKDSVLILDSEKNVCFLSEPAKALLPELDLGQNIKEHLPDDYKQRASADVFGFEASITPFLGEHDDESLFVLKFSKKYIAATYEYPFTYEVSKPAIVDLANRFYTPLTIVFSSLIFLNKSIPAEILDDKLKKALGTIRQKCYILLKLLGNLTDIASADPYNLDTELNLKTINITDFIKKTVASLNDFSSFFNIPITVSNPPSNIFISVDTRKLERILLILISNCFKYTKEDNQIAITLTETLNHIMISISDKGIGMSRETINSIFAPYRYSSETINKASGSSLIVAKIFIEQMGGTMIIESALNKGTKISFTISKNLTSSYNLESAKTEFCTEGLFAPKYIEFCDIIEYDNFFK